MAGSRKLTVEVLGNASGAQAALGGLDSRVGAIGESMMKFGAKMTAGVTLPIVAAFKKSIDAARESNAIGRITEAVIKTTGGAAKLTAQQIGDLAGKMSMQTGVSDELIQSSENILLTFKNVANQTGKNNDIFTRATKAALDMSTVMGTDMSGASVQLGKALNDPIKGITALGRAGVTFSEEQKKAIQNYVKTGDLLSAQKVIMKEVESEFGGAAAAAADPMAKVGQTVDNLQEKIGNILLPFIERAAQFLTQLATKFGELSPHMQNMIVAGLGIAAAIGPVVTVIGALATAIGFILSPIGLVIAAFVAFIAGLVWAYTHVKTFHDAVDNAFKNVKEAVGNALGVAKGIVLDFVDTVGKWWAKHGDEVIAKAREAWGWIKTNVPPVLNAIKDAIVGFIDLVKKAWNEWGDDLVKKAKDTWHWIQTEIIPTVISIKNDILDFINKVKAAWSRWGDDIKQITGTIWNVVAGVVRAGVNIVEGIITAVMRVIRGDWSGAWDAIKTATSSAMGNIGKAAAALGGLLWSAMVAAWNMANKAITTGVQVAIINVKKLPGLALAALSKLGDILFDAGAKLVGGFVRGIGSMFGAVKDKLGELTGKLTSWKGPEDLDAQILTPAGKSVIQGFVDGIAARVPAVKDALTKLTLSISSDMEASLLVSRFEAIGGNVGKGTAKGIKAKASLAVAEAKKMTDEIVKTAQDAAAKIEAAVSGALGRASAGRSLEDAKTGQKTAEENLASVRGRASTIAGRLQEAEEKLAAAKAKANQTTAEEQVAIEQATKALKAAQEAFDKGEISAAELEVAQNNLTKAQEAASASTSDVTDAEQNLANLRKEQQDIAKDLADAEKAVADANDRVVDATLAAFKANKDWLAQGPDALKLWEDYARAAGLTATQIERVNSALAATPPPSTPATGAGDIPHANTTTMAGIIAASAGIQAASANMPTAVAVPAGVTLNTFGERRPTGNSGGDVYVTVQGSVLTERELVYALRDGLATAQGRGFALVPS